jgi:hypothetical protein
LKVLHRVSQDVATTSSGLMGALESRGREERRVVLERPVSRRLVQAAAQAQVCPLVNSVVPQGNDMHFVDGIYHCKQRPEGGMAFWGDQW